MMASNDRMRLRLRVFGLPLHPFLVHFPIAIWLAVPVLDIAALYAGPEGWWHVALAATWVGVVIGAMAIASGLLEYLQPSLAGIDMRLAARHGVRTTLAWCAFTAKLIVAAVLPLSAWAIAVCLLLDLVACGLLVQGVYFGTRQVYQQLEKD
jgi:uncharacterized membrane protein